jgi:hypothetical protein
MYLKIYHRYNEFNFSSAPLTYCFYKNIFAELDSASYTVENNGASMTYCSNENYSTATECYDLVNTSVFRSLEICLSDNCTKKISLCSNYSYYSFKVNIIMGCFLLCTEIVQLLRIETYEQFYWLAKKLRLPWIHFIFLQNTLMDKAEGCWKTRRMLMIEKAGRADKGIFNKRGNFWAAFKDSINLKIQLKNIFVHS